MSGGGEGGLGASAVPSSTFVTGAGRSLRMGWGTMVISAVVGLVLLVWM